MQIRNMQQLQQLSRSCRNPERLAAAWREGSEFTCRGGRLVALRSKSRCQARAAMFVLGGRVQEG